MAEPGANTLKLELVSPTRSLTEDIREVTVPGADGIFTVLPGHESLLALLDVGVVEVRTLDGHVVQYYVNGGFAEVLDNRVRVLAQEVQRETDIDVERAKSARERAEQRLKQREGVDVFRAEYALRRAIARIKTHNMGGGRRG